MSGTVSHRLIVLGATGCVGRAVISAAADAGLAVLAVARDGDALDDLRAAHAAADIAILTADLANDDDASGLASRLRQLGHVPSGVVAAVGGTVQRGRLLDSPADALRRRFDEDVLPHLSAARQLIPLLAARDAHQPRGGYVLIGGPAADRPWAGYGQRSVAAAALQMLARVLHEEARAVGVRVQLLNIASPARTGANARHACNGWPAIDDIARHALSLAQRGGDALEAIVRLPAAAELARHRSASSDDRAVPRALTADASAPVTTAFESARAAVAAQRSAPSQDAELRDDDVTPTSLRDARALLRAIAIAPRIKETSP